MTPNPTPQPDATPTPGLSEERITDLWHRLSSPHCGPIIREEAIAELRANRDHLLAENKRLAVFLAVKLDAESRPLAVALAQSSEENATLLAENERLKTKGVGDKCEGCGTHGPNVEYKHVQTTNGGLKLCILCLYDVNRKNPMLPPLLARVKELETDIRLWMKACQCETQTCDGCKASAALLAPKEAPNG